MIIHISTPTFYEFEGWAFEYSRNKPFGPWPVKNDLEPRARAGRISFATTCYVPFVGKVKLF